MDEEEDTGEKEDDDAGQANVFNLNHDETATVNRLVALGFSQQQVSDYA